MKEDKDKKQSVRVTEGTLQKSDKQEQSHQNLFEKFKKPIIFGLMGIVFGGCMYLIFKPSSDKKEEINIGLNDAVPEATGSGMQADKQKAYEQELLDTKEKEKERALTTLADYWNTDKSSTTEQDPLTPNKESYNSYGTTSNNQQLNSYRNAQSTLGSFYQNDHSETLELRKQIDELKDKLAEKDIPKTATIDDQMLLMEKSYQMAAKYLPSASTTSPTPAVDPTATSASSTVSQKTSFSSVVPAKKGIVSALYREPSDEDFIIDWNQSKNRGFHTVATTEKVIQLKNSIRACVYEEQTVSVENSVKLRLLEPALIGNITLPKGAVIIAAGKFQTGRLQLKVTSVEHTGMIIPVDLAIYDLDGQQGLYLPYSQELNALSEMAANMSQTSGSSLMLTQSAGQQVAADLSRGVVQGISDYFSKKARTPKVTLKAGHEMFLVSKN